MQLSQDGKEVSFHPRVFSVTRWLDQLGKFLDIRLLLIGSMLPDIIDKPVGHIFFREIFSNGRIFSHTLLFMMLFAIPAIVFYVKRKKTWLLALSSGIFAHLILDAMWTNAVTLYWPLYGWKFPRLSEPDILTLWLTGLVKLPVVYIPELIGIFVLAGFFVWLIRRRNLINFLSRSSFL